MSSTRNAKPGSGFRQWSFASSPEFELGLMGNLVARRCELLDRPEDRELIWFLQLLSHGEGLPAVADGMLALRDKRITAKQLAKWKRDLESFGCPDNLPCGLEKLANYLSELCLNPATNLNAGPYYCPDAPALLKRYKADWIERRRRAAVVTEIGRKVCETLDFALETRCMVLIDGKERIGKTHAAKAWCALHPGQARYIQVPSTNDEVSFCRAVAKSLGVSINSNSKAQELRQRSEDVLQGGHLMAVFDEAHYLWPNTRDRDCLPGRINWIMTALVNHDVPVALITTPQFLLTQQIVAKRSSWASGQFVGRIGHYEKLPDTLTEADLFAVARASLPEGDAASIDGLVRYAKLSLKYLAAIEAAARRARYLAKGAGRDKATCADVRRAIKENVMPSDTALAAALEGAAPASSRRARSTVPAAPAAPAAPRGPDRNGSAWEMPERSRETAPA